MFKTALKENDFFLTSSSSINEISKPLSEIGISYVTYIKNFKDGSQINLSNNAEWIEHYYNLKLYETSLFERSLEHYKTSRVAWPVESALEIFKHGREYFDSAHGVTVVEKSDDFCEFFFFSGSKKNTWLTNFLINNFDILESFISYFKEKLKNILHEAEKSRVIIPRNYILPLSEIELENDFLKFSSDTLLALKAQMQSEFQRNTITLLSARELEIAHCLIRGQTAKETARALSISPRTVERHLDNIKEKLHCRTKFELVNRILENHLI